jgi:hypothetical protein
MRVILVGPVQRRLTSTRSDNERGDPKDAESMQRAVARWHAWMEQRREWAAAHGVDEDELDMTGSQPWGVIEI